MDTAQKLDHSKTIYGHKDLSLGCVKHQDTKPKHDRFCDVTLVVSDAGKEFHLKAHRDVLAEASPFFEKLLHSDMKENKEGVILLDILSESVLKNVLDFIYTGSVEILAPQHAEELIVAADYLFLSNLKNFAGRFLGKTLCVLNCLSYLDFAEKYQCEMLANYTKDFIHANFPAVAECEEFFNLSSEEVERWISSDEINVSAEEEVFEIICRWIKQRKEERKPKFSELFRHVRLIYISRDYLSKKIKKNSLIKNTRQCLASVTSAISWLDRARESLDLPSPQPIRKSLEKHVIVIAARKIVCFLPDNGTWYKLPKSPSKPAKFDRLALRGNKMEKLSSLCQVSERYDALLNRWTSSILPRISDFTEAWLDTVHDTGEDIYATLCNGCGLVVSLWKYNQSSGSWRSIALPYARNFPCVAFKEKFVYAFGGVSEPDNEATTHSARLDTVENNWKEITAMQTARYGAYGVAVRGMYCQSSICISKL